MDIQNGEFDKRWCEGRFAPKMDIEKLSGIVHEQWERINDIERVAAVNAAMLKVLLSICIPMFLGVVGLVFKAFIG
jgi:hypothetical protein